MEKSRRSINENNYKMTDFFTQRPGSSRPPPSSAPAVPSTVKRLSKQVSESRKLSFSQTQPSTQMQSKLFTKPPASSPLRSVKKENAPPFPSQRMQSSLSRERDVTCISSSSDTPTHLSISNASLNSFDSSVVEVVPTLKQNRRQLQKYDVVPSPPLSSRRRRPSKSQTTARHSNRTEHQSPVSHPRKPTLKKRKKPEGVQSDDGDVIDLDAMEEVIYVSSKPTHIDLVTPEPSASPQPSTRKRACLSAIRSPDASPVVIEVVPSSQSDERELTLPKKSRKKMQEIADSVREWRGSSSQSFMPPESNDHFETPYGDLEMNVDLDFGCNSPRSRNRSNTPTSSWRSPSISSLATPQKSSVVQARAKSSSPRKFPASAASKTVGLPEGTKSPSPPTISSASSLTKVDTPLRLSSPTKTGTPKKSPGQTPFLERIASPGKPSPRVDGSGMNADVPLLNPNEKADAIVERIKAEARAKAMAMPDEDSMALDSLDGSDSDLGSPRTLFARFANDKRSDEAVKNPNTSRGQIVDDGYDSPLTDIDESDGLSDCMRSERSSDRRSPSPIASSTRTRTRRPPPMLPTVLSKPTGAQLKKPVNPFAKLRKEKARREKRIAEIDANPDMDDNLSDASGVGSAEARLGSCSQLRRQSSDEADLEAVVREADRNKLFGEDDAGALGRILESDRKDRHKGREVVAKFGIELWESSSDEKRQEDSLMANLPHLGIPTGDQSLQLLQDLVATKDVDGVVAILQSGLLTTNDNVFIEWLFGVAISTTGNLATTAYTMLERVCESRSRVARGVAISSSPVLRAIGQFGARQDMLRALHVQVSSCRDPAFTDVQRSEALWRLSEIVRLFASEGMLRSEDVPSYFGLLITVGMGVKTRASLRLSIKRTLAVLINSYCGAFSDERGEMEVNICTTVLGFIPGLNAANKEYLLSFIDSERPVARRIGQWVAFAMLTRDYGARLARESVIGPPPLVDIIALLDHRLESELRSDLFNISRNLEHFDSLDYAELGHHVEVLGRVLMNIAQYTLLEKNEARGTQNNDSSPRRHKESPKLDIIKGLLERLGNNIADTRAAHLDRSHAKAVIQQLAMRIEYQRKAARDKPKLENYFRRKMA